jgi:hypothetical protein
MLPPALAGLLLSSALVAQAAAPLDAGAACRVVQKTVAARLDVPDSGPPDAGWFCEFARSQNPALYVVALKASRPLPSGNLVGWYAVARASGTVYEWDVATKQPLPLKVPGNPVPKP